MMFRPKQKEKHGGGRSNSPTMIKKSISFTIQCMFFLQLKKNITNKNNLLCENDLQSCGFPLHNIVFK